MREKMSEWVLHCAVDQRHLRRSQPTRDTALETPVRNYFKAIPLIVSLGLMRLLTPTK